MATCTITALIAYFFEHFWNLAFFCRKQTGSTVILTAGGSYFYCRECRSVQQTQSGAYSVRSIEKPD